MRRSCASTRALLQPSIVRIQRLPGAKGCRCTQTHLSSGYRPCRFHSAVHWYPTHALQEWGSLRLPAIRARRVPQARQQTTGAARSLRGSTCAQAPGSYHGRTTRLRRLQSQSPSTHQTTAHLRSALAVPQPAKKSTVSTPSRSTARNTSRKRPNGCLDSTCACTCPSMCARISRCALIIHRNIHVISPAAVSIIIPSYSCSALPVNPPNAKWNTTASAMLMITPEPTPLHTQWFCFC